MKEFYLHFHKTHDNQIWQAATPRRIDSSEINQAGAGDFNKSRSCDKWKPYLHNQSAYGYQTFQDGNVPWLAPALKVTWPFDHVVLGDHVRNWNHYISTTTMPMTTRVGRVVTYLEWLLPVMSHDHMITWSNKITWQTKIIIYLLPQCL